MSPFDFPFNYCDCRKLPYYCEETQKFGYCETGADAWEFNASWNMVPSNGEITQLIPPRYYSAEAFGDGFAAILMKSGNSRKWGYINEKGQVKIKAKFDRAGHFYKGHAWAVKDGRMGVINKRGRFVVKPAFDDVIFLPDDLFEVILNGKSGIVNKKGKTLLKPVLLPDFWDNAYNMDGWVFDKDTKTFKCDSMYGFVNLKTGLIIEPRFDRLSRFYKDQAVAMTGNRVYYINGAGKPVSLFDSFTVKPGLKNYSPYSEYPPVLKIETELYPVRTRTVRDDIDSPTRYGYVNHKGKFIIDPVFVNAKPFMNGLAAAKAFPYYNYSFDSSETNGYGFINKSGEFVIPPMFDEAFSFSEGLARVRKEKWIYDSDMRYFGKVGFINKTGEYEIEPRFYAASDFSEGFAAVYEDGNTRISYIDKSGQQVIAPQFHDAGNFSDGLAPVTFERRGKWGYINKSGELVIKCKFERANNFKNGRAYVRYEKKSGYIDVEDNFSESEYDHSLHFNDKHISILDD